MNLVINKVVLWLKNGKKRVVEFEENKVNIITGDSHTGKTAILEIIDYCLFSSKPKISESMINEYVSWYGIQLDINDKRYTVGRGCLAGGRASSEYYFSSDGFIPDEPIVNNTESSIKALFETEFSIDRKVAIPYGSNSIKAGSKVSLRYFLLFNTISANIIENDSGVFFDKQNETRYRDALPRIFDLALGIETVGNVLKKEKKQDLIKEHDRLLKKMEHMSSRAGIFKQEQEDMIREAKEFSLIDQGLDFEGSLSQLEEVALGATHQASSSEERDGLEQKYYLTERRIKNIRRFASEYESHKKGLKHIEDSLKPIEFLLSENSGAIKTSIFNDILSGYSSDLVNIRRSASTRTPIDRQVNDILNDLEESRAKLADKLSILPKDSKSFEGVGDKYFFLGGVKAKMDLYSSTDMSAMTSTQQKIAEIEGFIEDIVVDDNEIKKELTIKLIEEFVGDYMSLAGAALENYSGYSPVFDYKNKSLLLRKPGTSFIDSIGSSSNHMFMHLFFSLAMHETVFRNKSPFIAPFLIIDQPSRPYYGGDDDDAEDLEHSDESKIKKAFNLLNDFVGNRVKGNAKFQMIVFEHVPVSTFESLGNFHLVELFKNGNALIPRDMINA